MGHASCCIAEPEAEKSIFVGTAENCQRSPKIQSLRPYPQIAEKVKGPYRIDADTGIGMCMLLPSSSDSSVPLRFKGFAVLCLQAAPRFSGDILRS
jgi:hypothetical protein